MSSVLAIGSQKGGIGKTTSAGNLAVAWAAQGARVLAVDLDPQFALTRRFGWRPGELPGTTFEVLSGQDTRSAILPGAVPGVDLLGARRELARLELALAGEHHREQFLADALSDVADYDVIVIDCPPNLGLLTVNAFVAAQGVVVPVDMTDEGALQGAAEVRAIVDRLAQHSELAIRALVRTKVDRRRVVYRQMNETLWTLGLPVADTEVPLAAAFQNAAAEWQQLLTRQPDGPGAGAYRRLAWELWP